MKRTAAIFGRELAGYFATPLALVLIVVFLFSTGVATFYLGGLLETGEARLDAFFEFHPWIYLFFLPAVAMRLWAEERRAGTMEVLLTLPVSLAEAVLGKFLAAWAFAGVALALTFPMWLTVNHLGAPDNGVILAGYLGSFLMAGGYLAIGSCLSAATRSQVIAFVVSVIVCFLFTVSGLPLVLDAFSAWTPAPLLNVIAGASFLAHFKSISRGVVDLPDIVFFVSLIAVFLAATAIVIDMKKAGQTV